MESWFVQENILNFVYVDSKSQAKGSRSMSPVLMKIYILVFVKNFLHNNLLKAKSLGQVKF